VAGIKYRKHGLKKEEMLFVAQEIDVVEN